MESKKLLDLQKMSKKVDDVLSNETIESMDKWISAKRNKAQWGFYYEVKEGKIIKTKFPRSVIMMHLSNMGSPISGTVVFLLNGDININATFKRYGRWFSKFRVSLDAEPKTEGTEEGEPCNRNRCIGLMRISQEPCYCAAFSNPPCANCTNSTLKCFECGF